MTTDKKELRQHFFLREIGSDGQPIKGRTPLATIAFVVDKDGNIARGITICSTTENWNREEGRKRAYANARHAIALMYRKAMSVGDMIKEKRPIGLPVNIGGKDIVRDAALIFMANWRLRFGEDAPTAKVMLNPPLNDFEKKLLETAAVRKAEADAPKAAESR